MNARELLWRVEDSGIDLTLVGGKIRYRAKSGPPAPELLSEMKRHRAELVALLERRKALQWPPVRRADEQGDRRGPLSWAQQKVWATRFFFDDGTYNLSGGLRLKGRLDQAAFEAALSDLHSRHSSLRTVFTVENGAPMQRILKDNTPGLVFRDLAHLPPQVALEECVRECDAMAASQLALDQVPPVRVRLYRLAKDDHALFAVLHHVIADGVSVRLLMKDLGHCYTACLGGDRVPPARDLDMIDYALFEEEHVQCADFAAPRQYWRNALRGVERGLLPLPPRRESVEGRAAGGACALVVDVATTAGVRRLASASHASIFLITSAAVVAMLSRFTGRNDIIVGVPVARRDRAGLNELVGLLLDVVPIRVEVGGDPTFLDLVRRVRRAVLGGARNAVIPIELALGDDSARRASDRLFNVVLTDNGTRLEAPRFRDLEATSLEVAQVGAKFDLNFLVRDDGGTLRIDVEFDRRVVDEADAHAMSCMVRRILAEGAADAARRVLDLAPAPGIAIAATGDGAPAFTEHESLFSRLAAVAAAQSDAIALEHDGSAITYGALCERVVRVARGLRRQGVGVGDVVPIALPRGIDLIAAMLGVMGSGAACLVLDEGWPQARADQVLRDAKVRRIIAVEPDAIGGRMALAQLGALGAGAEPLPPVPSSAIAYLIYTSGSTGRPKGVQVQHRNVLNLLDGTRVKFGFGGSDVWTLFHSCAFDFSVWEVFGCLLSGGRLIIVPQETARDPEAFVRLLRRHGVTILNLTPSALSAAMRFVARDPRAVDSVRCLIFGGEALHPQLIDRWFREVGDRSQLVNMYGITETTVHASWRWLKPGPQALESEIGEALPGTALHILYDDGKPVDERCVGEIYVGGAGVATGYVGQPRETALRFVPDPFASIPGSRMYRSGDLGRRNGCAISYLGRRDSQVQVNGFRVELSEIEAVLASHPRVAAAAAAAVKDDSGMFIVAVVVPEVGRSPSPAELLHAARGALPPYMVPRSVALVPELPLTPNGKLDRAAVAAAMVVEDAEPQGSKSAAPQGGTEATLLELFQDVLHDNSVSSATNFFERGGDSMRAIRLVTLAADRGLLLNMRDVYATPILKDLAQRAVVRKHDGDATAHQAPFALLAPDAVASFGAAIEDAYPLTALQFGMIYLKELAPDSGVYHIVLSYRVRGRMDPDAFRAAAQAVTDMHPVLRTSFDLGHPSGPMQRVHARVEAPVAFADLRHLEPGRQTADIAHTVERERNTGFDLTCPALFRLVVLTLSDEEYQLVFTHHHAILDGWSVNIFFDDLHKRYVRSCPSPVVPPLRNVFSDYVALERGAMEEPRHLEFWAARLLPGAGLVAPGRPGSPVMRQVRVEMRKGIVAELRSIASKLHLPIKPLLLGVHLRVLAWLMGRDEVVTGQVVNARPEARDSDRVLGLFLNEYPMRTRLKGRTWSELARQAHLDEQAMMPHRFYPHALIQQHHGKTPIFDNYFNFTDFHTTRRLVSEAGLDILDVNEIESTHYALGANYTVDVRTGELRLILEYDESALARSTAVLIASAHESALAALLVDPHAACLDSTMPSVLDFTRLLAQGLGEIASGAPVAPTAAPTPRRAPHTPIERSVHSVWVEVLGRESIDLHTSFFDAGGTSLAAMRVVSRLRALHGDLSMEAFMNAPTVADLARSLDAMAPSPDRSPLVASSGVKQAPVDGPHTYPLTSAQTQLWRLAQQLPGLPLFGMPGALRVEGLLDLDLLERTFASLLARHAALRTRIAVSDCGPVQIVEPHAELKLEAVDLRASSDPMTECEELMARALLDTMDLARSPLVRVIAFRLADNLHVIYINIHHIVCDGWSLALLISEAAETYRNLAAPAGVLTQERPLGSGEVARAELDWTKSPQAAAQRRYWVERLAPPWPSLAGRSDYRLSRRAQGGILERLRPAYCRRHLPRTVVEPVRAAGRRRSMTEFMLFLTALASTLRAWSGLDDIRIATLIANRGEPDLEPVVGLLANTVVLRLDLAANPDPIDLALQARRVCIEAYERQKLPFADVLDTLGGRYPAEDRTGQLFEVMLLAQEQSPEVVLGENLRLAPYTPQRGALRPPMVATTCDFVLAVTSAVGELTLDLQYAPATTDATVAQELLDDIATAIVDTARTLRERP